jgi:hypothetical protein
MCIIAACNIDVNSNLAHDTGPGPSGLSNPDPHRRDGLPIVYYGLRNPEIIFFEELGIPYLKKLDKRRPQIGSYGYLSVPSIISLFAPRAVAESFVLGPKTIDLFD